MSASPAPTPEGADQAGPLYLTWDDIGLATTELAQQTLAAGVPQAVVGIVRGGLIPAVWIAHRLGVHDVRTVEVTRTTSDAVNAAKTPLPTVRNPAALGDLAGLDVLLVDDIAGSGTHKGAPYGFTDKGPTAATVRSLIRFVLADLDEEAR